MAKAAASGIRVVLACVHLALFDAIIACAFSCAYFVEAEQMVRVVRERMKGVEEHRQDLLRHVLRFLRRVSIQPLLALTCTGFPSVLALLLPQASAPLDSHPSILAFSHMGCGRPL